MDISQLKSHLFTIQVGLMAISEKYIVQPWDNSDLIWRDKEKPPKGYDVDTLQAVVDSINDLLPDD